jgi:lipid-A-disaccharide synthase-like uncharacterized protein
MTHCASNPFNGRLMPQREKPMSWIQAIGWLGQSAYFGRSLLQWLASERARRSVVPAGFWSLSVLGAVALLAYASLRLDPVIMLGQAVNLAIYLRNLQLAGRREAPRLGRRALRLALLSMSGALLAVLALSLHLDHSPWMLVGWLGQFIFLTRFPLQWWRAERRGKAELPAHFWWISLVGSILILLYALWREDTVIAVGQGVGLLTYGRNLMLLHRGHALASE